MTDKPKQKTRDELQQEIAELEETIRRQRGEINAITEDYRKATDEGERALARIRNAEADILRLQHAAQEERARADKVIDILETVADALEQTTKRARF